MAEPRPLGTTTDEMPMELRQRLRFWEFTTKRSSDGVSIGITFTVDGEPETATNRVWFGVAVADCPVDLPMLAVVLRLLQRRFEAFIAGEQQ